MPFTSSFITKYVDRGPWGDATYRGNTTGYLVRDFCTQYYARNLLDPMEGGGTSRDVARELAIDYKGYDLAQGHNILDPATRKLIANEAPPEGYDCIFWHPPYFDVIRYNVGDPRDFSSGSYMMFLQRMQSTLVWLATLLNAHNPRARMAIQMGDKRLGAEGKYYWIVGDLFTPKKLDSAKLEIDAVLVREQFNVTSDREGRTPNPLDMRVKIAHEYIHVLRRSL